MGLELFVLAWRLAPLMFTFAYYYAVRSALGVWDAVVIHEPGWTMPPQLAWPTWEMAFWSAASCGLYVFALYEVEERPIWLNIPIAIGVVPAFCITLIACALSFPMILAAANQPAVYLPVAGIVLACPWWLSSVIREQLDD